MYGEKVFQTIKDRKIEGKRNSMETAEQANLMETQTHANFPHQGPQTHP